MVDHRMENEYLIERHSMGSIIVTKCEGDKKFH